MIIIGAKGHAKEILDVLHTLNQATELLFFDNINENIPDKLYEKFGVIKSINNLKYTLQKKPEFVTGIGGTYTKHKIVNTFEKAGGLLISVISPNSIIGTYGTEIKEGANIMHGVYISNDVKIGKACLINNGASIHHDSHIGDYCEISPKAQILGRVKIGNFVSIGAGATVLPDIEIGNGAIIGAGAVVTKNVASSTTVVGVPAKKIII